MEVLVSMLVLAVGLLGFAGMHMVSIKSTHSAQLRSQATLLAHDLADRMRSARDAALDGRYDDDSEHADRSAWDSVLTRTLGPEATGLVVREDADVAILIRWNDRRGDLRGARPMRDEASEGPDADPLPAITPAEAVADDPDVTPEEPSRRADGTVLFAYYTEL